MEGNILDKVIEETMIRFVDTQGNEIKLSANATRRQYAPSATDPEWLQFIDTIEANGLDPRRREVYFTKYKNKDGKEIVGIVTGYQVYLARALASGKLAKIPEVRVVKPDPKNMDTWYGEVEITRTDMEGTATWQTPMKEVNKHQAMWNLMPEFMLKKNTGPQGLRYYLADVIGGMPYTIEELSDGVANIDESDIQPSEEEQASKNEAGIKYLDDLTIWIDGIKDISALNKFYAKNKKVYESSEMKDTIVALFASRKYDLVVAELARLSGFGIDKVFEYMNPDIYESDIVKEILTGNKEAINQFASDVATFLNSTSFEPEEMELPELGDGAKEHNPPA